MDVKDTPTIVFFNEQIEEQGIKISGLNSYETYVLILKKMLQKDPIPSQKPPLEDFLTFHGVAAHREISIVYDWTTAETESVMKKLRSEEHTSELQSRGHLVCRILLEKKKKKLKHIH